MHRILGVVRVMGVAKVVGRGVCLKQKYLKYMRVTWSLLVFPYLFCQKSRENRMFLRIFSSQKNMMS